MNKSKEEKCHEAEQLRQLAVELKEEQARQNNLRHQKVKELKELYDKSLDAKARVRMAEMLLDEEENDEIRTYAAAKKKMAILKREKENQILKQEKYFTAKLATNYY
jgi:hypothetical protein